MFSVNIYLFKVNNRSTTKRYETCSKLTIKTSERRWYWTNLTHFSSGSIADLEYINVNTAQKILALLETTDLVTFAKEILNGKRHFLCSVCNINSELLLSSREEAPCKTNSKLPNSQKPWHSRYSNEGLMRPVGSSSPRVRS